MPAGANVDRHTHPDDDEPLDVSSGDEEQEHNHHPSHSHSHSHDHTSSEEDESDQSEEDAVYSDEEHHDHLHREHSHQRHLDLREEDLDAATGSNSWESFEEDSFFDIEGSSSQPHISRLLPRSASQRQHPSSSRPLAGRRTQSSRDYATVPDPPVKPVPSARRAPRRGTKARSVTSAGAMHEEDYLYSDYSRGGGGYGYGAGSSRDYDRYSSGRSAASGFDDQYYGYEGGRYDLPPEHVYQASRRGNRGSMPPRMPSGGQEMMALGHYGSSYSPFGMPPGFSPYGQPGYGYPFAPQPDRADEERRRAAEAKISEAALRLKAEEDKLATLQAMVQKHHDDQIKREQKAEAARLAEAQAKAAAEYKAMEDKVRADEKKEAIKNAADKAKAEAEKEAKKKADEEKAKYDKELAEIKKKHAELEEAKKKLEAEAKALKPDDDKLKPPIRFKDAVGRKFSFPWHVCKTWKGMESLILQAFAHIENLGPLVAEGHYDLMAPDGEILLPQIWENVVKPDMAITMQMWPLPEKKKIMPHHHPGLGPAELALLLNSGKMPKKSSSKSKDKKVKVPMVPQSHLHVRPGMMPPPPPLGVILDDDDVIPPPPPPGLPDGVAYMPDIRKTKSVSSKKKGSSSMGLLGSIFGAPPKSKKKK